MKPKIEKVEINGYEAYLIDTGWGNEMSLTFNVQVGSSHDDPVKHAGRAHLWEHVIHNGSKKYPGHETMDDLNNQLGAHYNAYTAEDRVFYYYSVHPKALDKAVSILGAMVSEPDWSEKTFQKEKQTVKNEALEYQSNDIWALASSMMIHLTPKDHPFQMFDVGTQEQLDAMTLEDLQELYFSNYAPDSAQIVLAGNLNQKEISKDQLILNLQKAFFPPSPPKDFTRLTSPLKKKHFPSILGGENNYLEMATSSDQYMMGLVFEIPEDIMKRGFATVDLIVEYLNNSFDGSMADVFEKKNWITEMSAHLSTANNWNGIQVHLGLTEEGAENREALLSELFQICKSASFIDEAMLNFLQNSTKSWFDELVKSPRSAAEFFAQHLQFFKEASEIFEYPEHIDRVQLSELQDDFQRIFQSNRCIIGYLGNDVRSETIEPIFKRGFNLKNRSQDSSKAAQLKAVSFPAIPLNFVHDSGKAEESDPQSLGFASEFDKVYLKQVKGFSTGSLHASLKLPCFDILDSLKLDLLCRMYEERFKTELGYLKGLQLFDSITSDESCLEFACSGNAQASLDALSFVISSFKTYEVKPTDYQVALSGLKSDLNRQHEKMTAQIANREMLDAIHDLRFSSGEELAALASIDFESIKTLRSKLFQVADILIVASGDFSPKQIEKTYSELRTLMPEPLSNKQRQARDNSAKALGKIEDQWAEIRGEKDEKACGISFLWAGPKLLSPAHAQLVFANHILENEIYKENRIRRDLGYIHGSNLQAHSGKSMLNFYGQTQGLENLKLILEGWQTVLRKFKTADFDLEELQKSHQGLILSRSILPTKDTTWALRMYYWLEHCNNALGFNTLTEQISKISLKSKNDIEALGEQLSEIVSSDENSCFLIASKKRADSLKQIRDSFHQFAG